jgi:enoyl-CoA hydratase
MILTGKEVSAVEAEQMGLVNRLVQDPEQLLPVALALACQIAGFPQLCLRSDRLSAYTQAENRVVPAFRHALAGEFKRGAEVIAQEAVVGAQRFSVGQGRHGAPIAKL